MDHTERGVNQLWSTIAAVGGEFELARGVLLTRPDAEGIEGAVTFVPTARDGFEQSANEIRIKLHVVVLPAEHRPLAHGSSKAGLAQGDNLIRCADRPERCISS